MVDLSVDRCAGDLRAISRCRTDRDRRAAVRTKTPCFCQGRLMWARREQTAKGRPYRYPAGIAFTTGQDDEAIQAFIANHAVRPGVT